jgi:hypothetical protein
MPIALTDKIVALLASLTDEQIEALSPVQRRRLEHQCMAVMIRCVPEDRVECRYRPSSGVLAELGKRHRDE